MNVLTGDTSFRCAYIRSVIVQDDDDIWLASFVEYDLGYFHDETCRLKSLKNPFGPKVLPICPV